MWLETPYVTALGSLPNGLFQAQGVREKDAYKLAERYKISE